jgi:hypothetical protein
VRRVAVLLVLTGLAAGCGDGSKEPQTFSGRADALCTRIDAKLRKLGEPPSDVLGNYRQWVGRVIDVASEYTDGLKALKPPAKLEGAYQSYLFVETSALETFRAIDRKLAQAQSTFADALISIQPELTKLKQLGTREKPLERALGMTKCAAT